MSVSCRISTNKNIEALKNSITELLINDYKMRKSQ